MLSSLLLLAAAQGAPAEAPARPNVLFVLADDLGVMDIQPNHPGSFYDTPALEELALEALPECKWRVEIA